MKEFKLRSSFNIEEIKENYVLIKDNSNMTETMSVTNDAENVIGFLYGRGILANRRLFYIDTEGRVDELKHNGNHFQSFAPGYKSIFDFNQHKSEIKK